MKKIISLILALALTFSLAIPAFAKESNNRVTDSDPVVLVRGMDFGNVMLEVGTENQRKVNDFNIFTIGSAVMKTFLRWVFTGDKDETIDQLIDSVYTLLKYNSMGENGDPVYNTGMIKYPQSVDNYPELLTETGNELGMLKSFNEKFEKGSVYYVNYDWRLDPYVVADEINSAVNTAMKNTGHKKVNIVCSSMGGIMTVAYLTKYGYDNIGRCIFMSSTFCGSQIVTDVLTGKIEIKPERLYEYLSSFATDNPSLNCLLKAFNAGGLFNWATNITDYILETKKDEIYNKILIPIFAYSPCVWGLIAEENDYENAIKYIFGSRDNLTDTFEKRIDNLRQMMNGRTKLINEMVNNGVRVTVLSNYGSPLIPVYESADFSGDRTLEAYNTSGFATVAKYGETLGKNYKAENPELLSPDNCVDLSTAVLPEYTYMIKNAPHVAASYGTDYNEFVVYLLKNTGDYKAGSSEKYPRFMQSDLNTQSLMPFQKIS